MMRTLCTLSSSRSGQQRLYSVLTRAQAATHTWRQWFTAAALNLQDAPFCANAHRLHFSNLASLTLF